jgi:hypothetical protein
LASAALTFLAAAAARAQDDHQDAIPEFSQEGYNVPGEGDAALSEPTENVLETSPDYVPRPPAEVIPPSNLLIASWDLSEAPEIMPPPVASAQGPAWRTTFGSERRTEAEIRSTPASQPMAVDADVVLLQGVSDVAALRRLFPPRSWRIVVSRRVLPSGDPGAAYAGPASSTALPVRVTAIAVRAKRGLRITGREHILDPARPEEGAGGATAPSATVVRLADGSRMIWLLSIALPSACKEQGAACPDRRRVSEWQQAKQSAGEATVIGGGFARSASGAASPPPCSYQGIETDLKRSEPAPQAQGLARQGAGCVALLELPAG